MKHLLAKLFFASLLILAVNACKEDEPPLPDNLVQFESDAAGIEENQKDIEFNVLLTRAESSPVEIKLTVTPSKVAYDQEYTTSPAESNGELTLTIPAGQTTGKIKVSKKEGAALNGDETLDFKIASATSPVLVGSKSVFKLSFSGIVSESGSLIIQGKEEGEGGSDYHNGVYVDMSSNSATVVPRKSWNLGFYTGNDFRVILNPAYQSTAAALEKTDINAVTLADTSTIELAFSPGEGSLDLVDDWTGDLSKTAIAEVSATASENKVYLVSFEGSKAKDQWFKVKVTRNSNGGYKVEYARIGDTSIKSLDIPKDTDYNFVFASLETDKIVAAEPRSGSWDFQWSYSTFDSGRGTPYWFQDFILLNYLGGAEAAEAMIAQSGNYEDFGEAGIANLTFSNKRDAIGSKWRGGGGPGTSPSVKTDRFYVIKDPAGNYYKLRFTSLGPEGGRGRPEFEYQLIK